MVHRMEESSDNCGGKVVVVGILEVGHCDEHWNYAQKMV